MDYSPIPSLLFAHNTFIFYLTPSSLSKLNEDLSKISQWEYQRKMLFSLNVSKQV